MTREFCKIFNKKRFQFVLNVLHKVTYLYNYIMHFEIPALFHDFGIPGEISFQNIK